VEPAEPSTGSRRTWPAVEAFRVPWYGAVWSSNLLQVFAGQVHFFTVQWLVTDLTESRTVLGLVIAIAGVTVAITSPLGGVATDRFARRDLLVVGRVGMIGVVGTLALLVHLDAIRLWHILVSAVGMGLLAAISQPATQSYVFDVVGPDRTQTAVALNSAGMGLGQMTGPALAGILIAAGGIVGSWLCALAALAVATVLLLPIPVRGRSEGERRAPLRELREGFDYVIHNRPVFMAMLACAMAFFNGALFAMRPVFARHVLDVGSEGMGGLAAAAGLGTLLGAVGATLLPRFRRPGLSIVISMLGFSTCIFLYSFAFSYAYNLSIEFASGLFAQIWQISAFSGLQMAVPEALRGRVLGILFMLAQLAQVGGVFVGGLADRVGDQLAMGIFGAIPMVVLLGLLVFGRHSLSALGNEPVLLREADSASGYAGR
jgi:MFS family permease